GKEGRNWLKYVPSHLKEKFGENEFFFVYGDLFKQVEEPEIFDQGEVKAGMPTNYYEKFLEPFKKYEVAVVGGRAHFVADTRYGKVVCPGSAGLKPTRDSRPTFAVIDTVNTDVSFFEFDFEKNNTYQRIKEMRLPDETTDLLYHGYHGYQGL
ncbi:MAG: metallophosphatase family protein, partial [Archaeoglobaceae archaeon]